MELVLPLPDQLPDNNRWVECVKICNQINHDDGLICINVFFLSALIKISSQGNDLFFVLGFEKNHVMKTFPDVRLLDLYIRWLLLDFL